MCQTTIPITGSPVLYHRQVRRDEDLNLQGKISILSIDEKVRDENLNTWLCNNEPYFCLHTVINTQFSRDASHGPHLSSFRLASPAKNHQTS